MNKDRYPAIIVVEGASDEALLRSFLDVDIVTTNGSEVSRGTIDYLIEAKKKRDIVVLTDPDSPGKRIRDVLDQNIPGLMHAYIPKDKAIKRHKVGVAESDKDTILEALSHLVPAPSKTGSLTFADLAELGLIGGEEAKLRRAKIESALHLGHCNGKTLLKRANALNLTLADLKEALDQ